MTNYTQIVSRDIDFYIENVRKKIESLIEKNDKGSLSFHFGGRPIRSKKIDIIRLLSQIRFKSKIELAIRNVIIESVLSGESLAIGSGYMALSMFVSKGKFSFENCSSRSTLEDIRSCLSDLMGEGLSKNIVDTIVFKSSIDSRVKISCSDNVIRPVVRSEPYIEIRGSLHELFETQRRNISDIDMFTLDGVVESIGEIDSILQSFSSDKKPLLIIARGFSPDVVSTLRKNYSLGNLYVYPFVFRGTDEELEKLRSLGNFYEIENYPLLRTSKTSDFSFDKKIFFLRDTIGISFKDSIKRNVVVEIPSHLKSALGVLEDRINMGLRYAQEAARDGTALCVQQKTRVSIISAKRSLEVYKSLEKNLLNLNCIVLQEN